MNIEKVKQVSMLAEQLSFKLNCCRHLFRTKPEQPPNTVFGPFRDLSVVITGLVDPDTRKHHEVWFADAEYRLIENSVKVILLDHLDAMISACEGAGMSVAEYREQASAWREQATSAPC